MVNGEPDKGSEGTASHGGADVTRRDLLHQGAAAGALVGASALLEACGSGSTTPAASTTQTSVPQKHGGSLRVGLPQGGPNDTIDGSKGLVLPDYARFYALYDPLVVIDPKTFDLTPWLAEEFTPNTNATEWTVRLRQGIEFHDGKPIRADDLIFTIQRAMDPKLGSPSAPFLIFLDPHGMKKLDARTVRLTMTRPYLLQYSFYQGLFLLPVGYDPNHPIGTGPFKYGSFTPGQRSVFSANDNYWKGRPFADELQLIDISDDTARLNAQLGGQTDLMVSVPFASAPTVKSAPGQKLVSYASDQFVPIVMNCTAAPYSDPRVRQAMRLLADRPKMVEVALSGFGRVGNDLYSIDDPLYDTGVKQRTQDVEQARSLLKAAGHSNTAFTFDSVPLVAGCVQAAQVFAETATTAGVNVKVNQLDNATWASGFGKWGFTNSQWAWYPYVAMAVESDGPKAAFPETHLGDVDKPFANLYYQLIGEVDAAKRKDIAHEMQRIQWERGGYLVYSFPTILDAASDKVTGYRTDRTGYDFASLDFRHVSFV
jgi:peptide/nickel transport system substrate-binding protein